MSGMMVYGDTIYAMFTAFYRIMLLITIKELMALPLKVIIDVLGFNNLHRC